MTFLDISRFVNELEGEYKWYVLSAIILLLTAFITRFVFKTLKWVLLLLALGVLIFAAFGYLVKYS